MAQDKTDKVITDNVKDHYETQVKSANYLLVAHAAGLVGCLSVLKDYATTPHLKGMGMFVTLFGIGLLGAIMNYVGIALSVMAATSREAFSKAVFNGVIAITVLGGICGLVALVTLVIAIWVIIVRFSSL